MAKNNPNLEGTFHRRELNHPAIAFSSAEGRKLFHETLLEGGLESYFPLAEHFITQGHPAFCGVGSLTMALNSLLVDPKRVWQGVWRWFDESMLDCCTPMDVIKLQGITLSKLACLARCNGASVDLYYGSDVSLEEFREHVVDVCTNVSSERRVMIASYHRGSLNQTGTGHFSPIGAYNRERDMVLIMDVARFKYPPHWVPLGSLYNALLNIDPDSGFSRGYMLVGTSAEMLGSCSSVSTDFPVCSRPSSPTSPSTISPLQPTDADPLAQSVTTCGDSDQIQATGSLSMPSKDATVPDPLAAFFEKSSCCGGKKENLLSSPSVSVEQQQQSPQMPLKGTLRIESLLNHFCECCTPRSPRCCV